VLFTDNSRAPSGMKGLLEDFPSRQHLTPKAYWIKFASLKRVYVQRHTIPFFCPNLIRNNPEINLFAYPLQTTRRVVLLIIVF
jgi:hypothetical protein